MEIEGQEGQMWKGMTSSIIVRWKNIMLEECIEAVDTTRAIIDINEINYSGNTNKLSKQKFDAR